MSQDNQPQHTADPSPSVPQTQPVEPSEPEQTENSVQPVQPVQQSNTRKKLEDLTPEELLQKKMIAEIKVLSKPFFLEPAFWTLIIALSATAITIESGVFDVKEEIVQLQTLKLENRKELLQKNTDSLQRNVDSLKNVVNLLNKRKFESDEKIRKTLLQEDSIKRAFKIAKDKVQSRKELKIEVGKFLTEMNTFLVEYKKRDNKLTVDEFKKREDFLNSINHKSLLNMTSEEQKKYADMDNENSRLRISNLNEEQLIFNSKYLPLASIYSKKIIKFQPELKQYLLPDYYYQGSPVTSFNDDIYRSLLQLYNSLKD